MSYCIRHLTTFHHDFQLAAPSIVAYEALEVAPNVIVRLELDNGMVGWGCAAPDQHVTGETAASVALTINERFRPALLGRDAASIETIWAELGRLAPHEPSAIAAIDIALYDLLGQRAGLPLFHLLGAARDRISTSVTLSIEPLATSLARARDFTARGFQALKIKCGLDADADIERVRAIRTAVGDEVRLSLDPNQGYTADETLRVLAALGDCHLAFIEQPVAASDDDAMRRVCAQAPVPVMADESVLAAQDVLRTPAPLVNLKLMKTGGITGARKASAVAEARGIGVMIGCMDESRISMAAAAHLALALKHVAYADLDGHLDIVGDVASGGLSIQNGAITTSAGAGLGVQINLPTA